MRRNKRSHGFTLIEVMMALVVLLIGGLGTLQLLDVVTKSNGNVSAENEALAVARSLRAELENIPLLRANIVNAEWGPGPPITTSLHAAVDGLKIGPGVRGPNGGLYDVQYAVTQWTPPPGQGPDRDGVGGVDVAALDILITVNNPGAPVTEMTRGQGARLLRPVMMNFRKDVQESASIAAGGILRW